MFIVRPVEDKKIQEELCAACKTPYLAKDFAYLAANVDEQGGKITGILGICQFAITEDGGIFHTVCPFPDTFDEEVMIIMVRTAMSFLHRIGIADASLAPDALCHCPADFVRKLLFQRRDDGIYHMDLEEFFASPCRFQAEQKEN